MFISVSITLTTHLPLCLGRRRTASPAGRGWDAEAVLMFVLLILAIPLLPPRTALCLPSAAAKLNWESNFPLPCYVRGGENSLFVFILFLASLKMLLLSDGGVETNRFSCLKYPKWVVSYPCCRTWLNPVCAFEKLFSGTSLACRSDLEQVVLTTGFLPTLMPLGLLVLATVPACQHYIGLLSTLSQAVTSADV